MLYREWENKNKALTEERLDQMVTVDWKEHCLEEHLNWMVGELGVDLEWFDVNKKLQMTDTIQASRVNFQWNHTKEMTSWRLIVLMIW